MKILGISASPRKEKSQTLILLQEALSAAEEKGVLTELVQLPDMRIEFCLACDHCHRKKGCIIEDDVFSLLDKFFESDGFILASPVYIRQVTASLKAVMDRSSHFIHCQRLLGKYAACIVTSGGGKGDEVLEYIKNYAITTGAFYIGGVSSRVPLAEYARQEARILGRSLEEAIRKSKQYPDQQSQTENFREFFKEVIESRKEEWKQEFEYWQERGWI